MDARQTNSWFEQEEIEFEQYEDNLYRERVCRFTPAMEVELDASEVSNGGGSEQTKDLGLRRTGSRENNLGVEVPGRVVD